MFVVDGILTRVWRFDTSVLTESKALDNLVNIATVCCNSSLSADDDDDDDDDGDAEVVLWSESDIISLVKCSAARRKFMTVVVAARLRSVTDVLKLFARSLRLSLKHTHQQHHQHLPSRLAVWHQQGR